MSFFTNNNNNQSDTYPQPEQWPIHDGQTKQSIKIDGCPNDTVSALNFSPQINNGICHFAASSWDGSTRVWELNTNNVQANGKKVNQQNFPILANCWSPDGQRIYLAGADNKAYCWEIGNDNFRQIGQHDKAITSIHCLMVNNQEVIVTGSLDQSIRFWMLNNSNPVFKLDLGFKIYDMDACFPYVVAIGQNQNGKQYSVITVANGQPQIMNKAANGQDWPVKLDHQYNCVEIFKNKNNNYSPDGFGIGAIEGRACIIYFNEDERKKVDPKGVGKPSNWAASFAFKCHRIEKDTNRLSNKDHSLLFNINFIKFHPEFQTLLTAGSDGSYTFWDKDQRQRLGPLYKKGQSSLPVRLNMPLTAGAISPDGKLFVFATGYDWSFGSEFANLKGNQPSIYIHHDFINKPYQDNAVNGMTPKPR